MWYNSNTIFVVDEVEQFCDSIQYGCQDVIWSKVCNRIFKLWTCTYVINSFQAIFKTEIKLSVMWQ